MKIWDIKKDGSFYSPWKALHHGTWRLRDLRLLLERAGPAPQLDFLDTHPLIRSLDAYEALTPDCFNPQPQTVHEPT